MGWGASKRVMGVPSMSNEIICFIELMFVAATNPCSLGQLGALIH